jgi:hypothetical protein
MKRFISDDAEAEGASCGAHAIVFAQALLKWAEPLGELVQPIGNRGRERLGRPCSCHGLLRKPRRGDQGEHDERCHAEADAHNANACNRQSTSSNGRGEGLFRRASKLVRECCWDTLPCADSSNLSDTHINNSDPDPHRDFVVTVRPLSRRHARPLIVGF